MESKAVPFFGVVLFAASLQLAGCQSVGTSDVVAVRAEANSALSTIPTGADAPKTYVFVKGKFLRSIFDPEVKKVDFDTLTKELATGMSPRFAPAPSASKADFIIVVHWGAVSRKESSFDTFQYDLDTIRQANEAVETAKSQATADFKAGNYNSGARLQVAAAEANLDSEISTAASLSADDTRVAASQADILGLRGLYATNDPSPQAEELRALLDDDRYIVTLIGLDTSALRLKKKKIAWTTRMSVPVGGRDFITAIRQMSAVASRVYGTQVPHMVIEKPAPVAR